MMIAGLVGLSGRSFAVGYEMQVTFSGYTNRTASLSNFPVLVVLSNNVGNSTFNFAQNPFVSSSGYDLRFKDALNNGLDYEIESWDVNSACYVWVKVPTLPTDGTGTITAQWGDPNTASQLPCTTNGAVWTSFNGVWHLNEAAVDGQTTMVHRDSTANRANGLQNKNAATNGVVGGSQYFDGVNDWIDIANHAALNMGSTFSVSAWMKFESTTYTWNRPISRKTAWDGTSGWELQLHDKVATQMDAGGSSGTQAGAINMVPTWLNQAWYHVTVVYNGTTATLYRDGVQRGSGTIAAVVDNTNPLVLGTDSDHTEVKWKGRLDEVRIQDGIPSDDWIWATYQTQVTNSNFCTYGDVALAVGMNMNNASGATAVTDTGATINGTLLYSDPAEVSVFWGPTDGLNVASAWSNRCDFGVSSPEINLATNLFNLIPNTQYYYRFRGIDSEAQEVWAPLTATFTTPGVPAITNLGTTLVRFDTATLSGNLLDGLNAYVTANWGTDAENLTSSLDLGSRAEGSFTASLSGLANNTVYYYGFHATNAYGDVWSEVRSFKSGNFVDATYTNATVGTMKYRVCYPQNYTPSGETVPVILYLHSAAERGTSIEHVFTNSYSGHLWVNSWINLLVDETQTGNHQAVLVIPQSGLGQVWNSKNAGDNWNVGNYTNASQPAISSRLQLAVELFDQVVATANVDTNRVYITGPSMGGFGTWDALARFPKKFAAAMPLSGGGNTEAARTVFNGKPVWAYHGAIDALISVANTDQLTDAMRATGGSPIYSRPAEQNHGGFDLFYTPGYFTVNSPSVTGGTGMNVYDWLFSQTFATGGTHIDKTAAVVVAMDVLGWARNLSGPLADGSGTIWYNRGYPSAKGNGGITLMVDTNGTETPLSMTYVSGSVNAFPKPTVSLFSDYIKHAFPTAALAETYGVTNNYASAMTFSIGGLNDRTRYTFEIISAPEGYVSGFEVAGREVVSGAQTNSYAGPLVLANVRPLNGTITLKHWHMSGFTAPFTAFRILRTAPVPAETVVILKAHTEGGGETRPIIGIPVTFNQPQTGYTTLVIEDAAGVRVRNLVAETLFPAGANTLIWDGYDDDGQLVEPGDYRVRGLRHDGLRLYYEFSFNSAGNPAWSTKDRSGAWMADHSLPAAAVFLRNGLSPYGNGQPQVMLGGIVAECGDPTIFAGETGQKLYGNHYFGWDGCAAAACDIAAQGQPDIFIYLLMGYRTNTLRLRGIRRNGTGVEIADIQTQGEMPREPANIGLSLAVRNGLAAISVPVDNEIVFIDLQTKLKIGSIPLSSPRGLCFNAAGQLFAISGTTIVRLDLGMEAGVPFVQQTQTVVASSLEAPYALTLDASGNLYVTDKGNSHQVKVFSANGALLRTIGNPGGLQVGHYDENRMQNPEGLALDSRGQLWVCEYDAWPKRVSVWDAATGKLVKGLYGPPHYGGGGTIDPDDPTRLFFAQYGNLTQWRLDWSKGEAKLENICVRRQIMDTPEEIDRWHQRIPERPMTIGGRTYLVPTFSGFLRYNDNTPICLLGDDGIAWPVAFVGTLRRWAPDGVRALPEVIDRYPQDPNLSWLDNYNDTVVAWSDSNFDHKIQTEEFTFRSFPELTFTTEDGQTRRLNRKEMNYCLPDLSAVFGWHVRIDAPTFDANGVPHYNLGTMRAQVPPRPEYGGSEEGRGGFLTPDGQYLLDAFHAVDAEGETRWRYPVLDPANRPQKGGEVNEPTRLLGPVVQAPTGEAGNWYAVNGERGNIFLMTTDGLYIQTLAGHMSTTSLLRYPTAERGMLIDSPESHISFEDEHFHPTITQTRDGKVYLVAGKEHSSIFRVEGFNGIRRIAPMTMHIDAETLAKLPPKVVEEESNPYGDNLPVAIGQTAPVLDGLLNEWPDTMSWVNFDGRASAALRVVGDTLYLAYRTGDPDAIKNDAADPRFLFKYGGAFDLQIRPDVLSSGSRLLLAQDRRLLIADVRGKMTAMLYYPDTPSVPDDLKVVFESPIGRVLFNQVEDVSDDVAVAGANGNFEISVPLAMLGIDSTPGNGQKARGDIGLIRGDGTRNIQRLCWHNRDTLLVSDIPSEARLVPANWGYFHFLTE